MKKGFILVVLTIFIAGGVFADENGDESGTVKTPAPVQNYEVGDRPANLRNNWISGEVSLLGAGARYERMLGKNFSVGANVYWNNFFLFWNEIEFGASVRYYPWGKLFFIGFGVGYHIHSGTFKYEYDYSGVKYTGEWFGVVSGVGITPEIGFKIDVGKQGGFFLQPGLKVPITLGTLKFDDWTGLANIDGEFRAGVGVVVYLGMGYAF